MTDALWTALTVAGFLLAQVISVKPEVSSAITPVALTAQGNDQRFEFLKGDVATELPNWERMLSDRKLDAWAFAYEATVVVNKERTDVFIVRAWARNLNKPVVIVQPWQPTETGGIELLGSPLLMHDTHADSTALPFSDLDEKQERAVRDGMKRNEELREKGWLGTPSK